MMQQQNKIKLILSTFFAAVVLSLVAANFFNPQKDLSYKINSAPATNDPRFAKEVGDLLDPKFVEGNRIETLLNGEEIFPAMLGAIRSAQKTITFESYIYWSGQTGKEFAEALAERARAGVAVHVLLDWAGSGKISDALLEIMKTGGVEIQRYHELKWYNLTRLNNRTHRKILILDGKVGFTGGVGIADEWTGDGLDPKHWRDTHFKVEGPVVNQMQSAFMDNWLKTSPEVLSGEEYFPVIAPVGKSKAQMFISSAGEGGSSVRIMYLMAIASAKKSIHLESAYFVPDQHVIDELVKAKKRGVNIQIIVPGQHNDSDVVEQASQELWGDLLESGITMYRYAPALFHCKVLIVDEYLVSVGSTNFDERSFRINDEANLNVLDHDFARRQLQDFDRDKQNSREITFEEWKNRPALDKFLGDLTRLFNSQL